MRKVIPFLSSVAIMPVVTLRQRLFLFQSDSGKQWAIMATCFGLCNLVFAQSAGAHGSLAPTRKSNGAAIKGRAFNSMLKSNVE